MKKPDYTPERRPLGARDWGFVRRGAEWLARLGVPPNAISIAGLVASAGAGMALIASATSTQPALPLITACLLILARGACNVLDGMVAVGRGIASPSGELYNEVPDRISDAVTFIGAGYALGGLPELGYLAAVAAVFTAYVRAQGCALGAPADFRGPMAKTHRMAVVVVAAFYTALAPASWQPAGVIRPDGGVMAVALLVILAGCAVTSWRRLRRCARFLKQNAS